MNLNTAISLRALVVGKANKTLQNILCVCSKGDWFLHGVDTTRKQKMATYIANTWCSYQYTQLIFGLMKIVDYGKPTMGKFYEYYDSLIEKSHAMEEGFIRNVKKKLSIV